MTVGVCKEEPPAPTRGKGPRTSPRSHGEQLHGGVATVAVARAESCILGSGLESNRFCSSPLLIFLLSLCSSSSCLLLLFLAFSSCHHHLFLAATFSCLLILSFFSCHRLLFLAAFSSCFLLIFLFFSATFCSPLFSLLSTSEMTRGHAACCHNLYFRAGGCHFFLSSPRPAAALSIASIDVPNVGQGYAWSPLPRPLRLPPLRPRMSPQASKDQQS